MTELPASIADLIARDHDVPPPAGWYPLGYGAGFHQMLGPVYGGRRGGAILIGFRCLDRHLNPLGVCHGGVTAAFCDYQGISAQGLGGFASSIMPTVSLSIDYLAPIRRHAWVEGRAELLDGSDEVAVCRFAVTVGAAPVAWSRGIFMIRPVPDPVGLALLRDIEAGGIEAAPDGG